MPIPYSTTQLAELNSSFECNPYLTGIELERLTTSTDVNLSASQLRNWFKNKRRSRKPDTTAHPIENERPQLNSTKSGAAVQLSSRGLTSWQPNNITKIRNQQHQNALLTMRPFEFPKSLPPYGHDICQRTLLNETNALLDISNTLLDSPSTTLGSSVSDDSLLEWMQIEIDELVDMGHRTIMDEYWISHFPRQGSWIEAADGWKIDGHSTHLDSLSVSPRMLNWVKLMCNASGIDAPTITLLGHDTDSDTLKIDQAAWDCALEEESWWCCRKPGHQYVGCDYRVMGEHTVTRRLCKQVLQTSAPAWECEVTTASTRASLRLISTVCIPVISIGGNLEGIVMISTRHSMQDNVLQAFMSSLALSLRALR